AFLTLFVAYITIMNYIWRILVKIRVIFPPKVISRGLKDVVR
ncbi:undecaprenyl-phosphate alpha-N-acetylglucosaminyl 1-phosphate transferase, partial [Acinetobacter baumannii]